MSNAVIQQAGTALVWRFFHLAADKLIFLFRLLVLARLLAPEDFGLLAIATAALGLFLSVTDFGMVPALIQSHAPRERDYHTAWTIGLIRALGIVAIFALAAPLISDLFAEPRAADLIRVLALRPLIEAAASIKIAEVTRNLGFRTLAFIRFPGALGNALISILLAPSMGVWALVIGALAGSTLYLVLSYSLAPHRPRFILNQDAASSLIQFGRWIFVIALIAVASTSMLRLVISRQLGVAQLGLYFLAARLAFLPAGFATEVVGAVAFPLYSRLQSDIQQATQAFRTIFTGMTAVLLPISAFIIALAPFLIETYLGARWEGTVPIIRLLTLVSIAGLFGEAAAPILQGLGRPERLAAIEGFQSLLLIALAWILTDRYGLVGAAFAWFPAVAFSQILSALFVRNLLRRPLAGLLAPLLAITAASIAGAGVAYGIASLLEGMVGFMAAVLVAGALTGAVLLATDRRFQIGLVRSLSLAFPWASPLARLSRTES